MSFIARFVLWFVAAFIVSIDLTSYLQFGPFRKITPHASSGLSRQFSVECPNSIIILTFLLVRNWSIFCFYDDDMILLHIGRFKTCIVSKFKLIHFERLCATFSAVLLSSAGTRCRDHHLLPLVSRKHFFLVACTSKGVSFRCKQPLTNFVSFHHFSPLFSFFCLPFRLLLPPFSLWAPHVGHSSTRQSLKSVHQFTLFLSAAERFLQLCDTQFGSNSPPVAKRTSFLVHFCCARYAPVASIPTLVCKCDTS